MFAESLTYAVMTDNTDKDYVQTACVRAGVVYLGGIHDRNRGSDHCVAVHYGPGYPGGAAAHGPHWLCSVRERTGQVPGGWLPTRPATTPTPPSPAPAGPGSRAALALSARISSALYTTAALGPHTPRDGWSALNLFPHAPQINSRGNAVLSVANLLCMSLCNKALSFNRFVQLLHNFLSKPRQTLLMETRLIGLPFHDISYIMFVKWLSSWT